MEPAASYGKNTGVVEIRNGLIGKRNLDISWGAIIAGWLVAAAAAMVLYILGAATGISAINLADPDSISHKMVISAAIWLLVSWTVALSLGSYFAAFVTRTTDKRTGGLQGIAVWALSGILTLLVGVTGLGAVGLAGIGGSLIVTTSQDDQAKYPMPAGFQVTLKERISSDVSAELKPETLTLMAGEFIRGDKDSAKNALLLNTSLSRAEAESVVNDLSRQTEEAKARVRRTADKAAFYTAVALWVSVLISVLSLAGSILAGKAGVREYITGGCRHSYKDEPVGLKA